MDVAGYLPDTRIVEQATLGDILRRYRDEITPTKHPATPEPPSPP